VQLLPRPFREVDVALGTKNEADGQTELARGVSSVPGRAVERASDKEHNDRGLLARPCSDVQAEIRGNPEEAPYFEGAAAWALSTPVV